MADINKADIKLMQSQRLDDTEQGGGQMTSHEVVDGQVNNLFPDISRLDRVYGRVSMRKAYLAVQTGARETYYGSHTIITEQASDPNVSVCFFSSEDWFDVRQDARDRIEGYLVRGPLAQLSLWGTHYVGTSVLSFLSREDVPDPDVGDVMVIKDNNNEQYVRIIDLVSEVRGFFWESNSSTYNLKVITITIGNALEEDYIGVEASPSLITSDDPTLIYTTVAADASRYYGVTTLVEDASAGNLQFRVGDIYEHLVPSAASETAIVDAGVGNSVSPLIQTQDDGDARIARSLTFAIANNSKLYIGEGIKRGTLGWTGGGLTLTDDSNGNVLNGSQTVGTVHYGTGTITFGEPGVTTSGTGTVSYVPACTPQQISQTGGIIIETSNRGFVYTFNCNPIPEPGTLKIEYLAGGKWYTMWDQGSGKISGLEGYDVGSGTLNFDTGSVSITLKTSPDVDSKILFFWAKPAEYYDFSGETLPLKYVFNTPHPAVARNTFVLKWAGDRSGNDSGNDPGGFYAIVDNGNGKLMIGEYNSESEDWQMTNPEIEIGEIKYATGEVSTQIGASQYTPVASEMFNLSYNYGDPETQIFEMPPRNGDGTITMFIDNTPIVPGTFRIEWHTDVNLYDVETRIDEDRDPAYIFRDDGFGHFEEDVDDGTTNWIRGSVNYATGEIHFMPDRSTVFPLMKYDWIDTDWLHPGVEQSYVFTEIEYIPTASIFPPDRSVSVSFCPTDGSNYNSSDSTLEPIYEVKSNSGLEIAPGGLGVSAGSHYLIDGTDGKLYTHVNGVDGTKTEVGSINYANKTFSISSDTIDLDPVHIRTCVGTAAIDPMMSMVFRAPGAPIRAGSAFIKAVNSQGEIIEGQAGFDGVISGDGISGNVDHSTGLCHVIFGKWVADNAENQAKDWYSPGATDGAGNTWMPYSVSASTIIMNCVVTSYLPLDPDLLGLNPVRLPLDGKVPIFRDGYIVVLHNSLEEDLPNPLSVDDPLTSDQLHSVGRTDVDLIELYSMPTAKQLEEGTQTVPIYVSDADNYEVNLETGTINILSGFILPKDGEGTTNKLVALSRIEDMCLASDVQITGHIAVTSPLVHDYTAGETLVSSVLPSADMQSRAYNEFEQSSWTGTWSDSRIGSEPLASYNFVDYPITVINRPSIKERWLLLFSSSTSVSIVGEKFGVLAENVSITTGNIMIDGNQCIAIENRQFPGEYYFIIRCDGFGAGWASGNCIRFNQDAANFPLWFVRTTLQAPPTDPIDHYTIQIRGDSS